MSKAQAIDLTKAKKVTEAKVSDDVDQSTKDLAEKISKHRTIENGHITYGKEAFKEAVESFGLDLKTVSKVRNLDSEYSAAVVYDVGMTAIEAMKKDSSVKAMTGSASYGRHASLDVEIKRESEQKKSVTDNTLVTVNGASNVKFKYKVSKKTKMVKVRKFIKQEATLALKK